MNIQNQNPLDKIDLSHLLPGAVCIQYRRCGKPNCHCANGKKHGPYYYRAQWEQGKLYWQYVKRSEVQAVQAACQAYRQFQAFLRGNREQNRQLFQAASRLLRQLEAGQ